MGHLTNFLMALVAARRYLNRLTAGIVAPPFASTGLGGLGGRALDRESPKKVLIVYAHPAPQSYTRALLNKVEVSLQSQQQCETQTLDLYAEGFDPALSLHDLSNYFTLAKTALADSPVSPTAPAVASVASANRAQVPPSAAGDANDAGLAKRVRQLKWADGLVLVYPTYWYSFPAILKGYFDRTFLPGVAFDLRMNGKPALAPLLHNLKQVACVTTYGNSMQTILWSVGDPARRILLKGLGPLFHPQCEFLWMPLYEVDSCSRDEREAFLQRVGAVFARF